MSIVIDNKFNIGDLVYLKTDMEQLPRMIFAIMVYKDGIVYKTCQGTVTSEHYDFEISYERSYIPT